MIQQSLYSHAIKNNKKNPYTNINIHCGILKSMNYFTLFLLFNTCFEESSYYKFKCFEAVQNDFEERPLLFTCEN